jgi:hypothetical protein
MHTTLSTSEIAGALIKDEYANWSRNGALALSEYLESLELEQGIELDVVALRCEFSEYESAIEAAAQYTSEFTTAEAALEYLEDHTSVITYDGGVIIQDF